MLFYYVLFSIVLVACSLYMVFYRKRYMKVMEQPELPTWRMTPHHFSLYAIIFSLLVAFSFSLFQTYTVERDVLLAEEYTIENPYLKEDNLNLDVAYVFTEYNMYFGGSYVEDGVIVISITNDAPNELVSYLESRNRPYQFVQFSYSELLMMSQLAVNHMKDVEGFVGISINEKTNTIIISTMNTSDPLVYFQNYIEDGVMEVVESAVLE
ncbi:MAG: hypothetical protein PHP32_00585 [Candidatus Izemoplasmatales bacterium]|nr:hypothetical protein [Candidatus Izemoplasmatales bacterium]